MIFADVDEVRCAYETEIASLHAKVKVRITHKVKNEVGELEEETILVDSTVGRAFMAQILPAGLDFSHVNQDLNKRAISKLINACYRQVGLERNGHLC